MSALRQLRLFGGSEPVGEEEEEDRGFGLREWLWSGIRDAAALREVARRVEVRATWLTRWLRGELEAPDETTIGRLLEEARRR